MNSKIQRSLDVINNLPKYLEASAARSSDGSMPLDYAINRCLKQIDFIKGFTQVSGEEKEEALREAWVVYLWLQDFDAPGGERQDFNQYREVHFHSMDEDDLWIDEGTIHTSSPDVYAGGLGFKHVNWDSNYLMAKPKGGMADSYWRPPLKPAPVKHYTREEIDKVFGSCG